MSNYTTKTEVNNLKEVIKNSSIEYGDKEAFILKNKKDGTHYNISYKELLSDVNSLGTKLIDLGLKGKRIALIGENSYEWSVAYLAIVCGTGIVVPLDKSLPAEEIENLIIRAEVSTIIYTSTYDETMKDIKNSGKTKLESFISLNSENVSEGVLKLDKLLADGKKLLNSGNKEFIDAEINNEEMTFMMFTSGTTAMSKAVMLSHKNITSNIMSISKAFDLGIEDRIISFLPLHHTFEATVGFLYPVYSGATICYCEGIKHISDNMVEYEMTAMVTVPLLIENMYKKIWQGIEKQGKTKKVKMAMKLSNGLRKIGIDIRRKVFKDIHNSIGGKDRLFVTGAAALSPEVEKGFNDLGFFVYQGYGLTETAPVLAASSPLGGYRTGSIGKPFKNVTLKIYNPDEEGVGEIIAKGPNVMLGYYNNEEATKEAIRDNWFHTGDLGRKDKDGYFYVTGREKDVIILKNGKNIYPDEVENKLFAIDGIKECMVFGAPARRENDLKLVAKIVYDKDVVTEVYGDISEEELKNRILEKVKDINKTMPPYKYVRDIIITEKEMIKTTTQKIKRFEEIKLILDSNILK